MPDILRYAAFAEETEYGVEPSGEPEFFIDIASTTLDVPTDPQIVVPSSLGREASRHIPGFYSNSGNVVYAADIRTMTHLWKWGLGEYKFTDNTAPDHNLHEVWGSRDTILPSFTAYLGKDLFEHRIHGCVITSMTLSLEEDFVQMTIEVAGANDTRASIRSLPTVVGLMPEEYPLAFHQVSAARDGSDITARTRSFSITVANGSAVDSGRTIGTRYPRRIPSFEREVTISATHNFDAMTDIELFWGDAAGVSDEGSTPFSIEYLFDAGDNGEMDIMLPHVILTSVPTQTSGRDEITQNVAMRAFQTNHMLADGETEVTSSLLVALQNNQEEA